MRLQDKGRISFYLYSNSASEMLTLLDYLVDISALSPICLRHWAENARCLHASTQPSIAIDERLEPKVNCGLIDAAQWSRSGVTPSKARVINTVEPSQSPWVRGLMIGTLPLRHRRWKKVNVCE
jgi:hypothetical protein